MTSNGIPSNNGRERDFDLRMVWENNLEIESIALKYAPETDLNAEEGLIASITAKYLIDGPEDPETHEKAWVRGEYLVKDMFCRNKLQDNWQEIFGTLKDATKKDGTATKALVPKFAPSNIKYCITVAKLVNKATGEFKIKASEPKLIGVWDNKGTYIPVGSMDDKREYTGPESDWVLAEE